MCNSEVRGKLTPSEKPWRRFGMEKPPENQGERTRRLHSCSRRTPSKRGPGRRPSGRGSQGHRGIPCRSPECGVEIHGYRSSQPSSAALRRVAAPELARAA
eukprot:12340151-Alexandrium_andersonii.AAC.1